MNSELVKQSKCVASSTQVQKRNLIYKIVMLWILLSSVKNGVVNLVRSLGFLPTCFTKFYLAIGGEYIDHFERTHCKRCP